MLNLPLLSVLVLTAAVQTAPTNPACSVLTASESASLIGAGGQTLSVTAAPRGSSCMVQNADKVITILFANLDSADAASGLWAAKERIVDGKELAGWPTKAYAGGLKDVSAVGLAKGKRFIEVRVTVPSTHNADIPAKLQTVMKAVAARLP